MNLMFHRLLNTIDFRIAEKLVKKDWIIHEYRATIYDDIHHIHATCGEFEINSFYANDLKFKGYTVDSDYVCRRVYRMLVKRGKKQHIKHEKSKNNNQLKLMFEYLYKGTVNETI